MKVKSRGLPNLRRNRLFAIDSSNRSAVDAVHRKRGWSSTTDVSSFTEGLHLSNSH